MKKYVVIICLFFCGCATSVLMINGGYPPRAKTDKIDFYLTQQPDRPYVEIAQLKSHSLWGSNTNRSFIEDMARKVGADAVIVSDDIRYDSDGSHCGIKAIAIKYK